MKRLDRVARKRSALVVMVAMICVVIGAASPASASTVQADLAGVRAATAQFHDVGNAPGAGYLPLLDCFDTPTAGMGQHFVDTSRLDASLDPLRPESLVYEVRKSGMKLGAVEYIVPKDVAAQPPTLFGRTFLSNDDLGLWVLHAWIWQPNPDGMFENFNPNIGACPST